MQFSKTVKEELPSGVPVINCHIQRNSDICPDLVEEAFEKAKQFCRTFSNGELSGVSLLQLAVVSSYDREASRVFKDQEVCRTV